MARKRAFAHGEVQGVGFRYHARQTAQRLGLRGWVRNRADGRRVEALVEGPDEAVERFLAWMAQGPPAGRVDRLDAEEDEGDEALASPFDVRPTA